MRTMRLSSIRGAKPFCPARVARVHPQVCNVNNGNFERTLMGDNFGARDARPDEIESNFGEKVIGNWNTEHIIKPPDSMGKYLGLNARSCTSDAPLLAEKEVERLRQQVPGWRIASTAAGVQCIRFDWKVKDAASGATLVAKVEEVFGQQGHKGRLHVSSDSDVFVEMFTEAAGGLTENDFIVAARINDLKLAELLQKKRVRYWA